MRRWELNDDAGRIAISGPGLEPGERVLVMEQTDILTQALNFARAISMDAKVGSSGREMAAWIESKLVEALD